MAATDKAITDLTALAAAPAVGDLIEIVDISEPLDADKNKQMAIPWLFKGFVFYENEVVSYENDLVFQE